MTVTDDIWLLEPHELDKLPVAEQEEYLRLMEQRLAEWRLAPKAQLAHVLASKVDWLLCGGAAGGSKSETLAFHALDQAKRIAGSHGLILRTSLPELRRSFILRTMVRFAQTGDDKRAKFRSLDNVKGWWFESGSIIEFGYMARDDDVGQFLSAEYDYVELDESTQFTPYQILMISGRLRTTKQKAKLGARPHMVMATNPGSQSHAWHRELFVEPTDYGEYVLVLDISNGFADNDGMIDWDKCRIERRIPAPKTAAEAETFQVPDLDPTKHLVIAFVPFRATDNPHLDPSYLRGLNALPEMERKQKRDGDWDAFVDRYFTEFSLNTHVVDPFEIPVSWDIGIGIDHGFSAPFAAIFGAWDGDGNCYIFDELYETKLTPQQQAERVKLKLLVTRDGKTVRLKPRTPVADPSTSHSKGEGLSISEQWRAAGLATVPASNARVDGWANVREYLRVPITDDGVGEPKLFVFSSCRSLIRELRNARQDVARPEDIDTHGDDHALDALRYLLAVRPRRGRRIVKERPTGTRAELMVRRELERLKRTTRSAERMKWR